MAGYKIRRASGGHALGVPKHIAEATPEGVRFYPRATDQGILYVAVRPGEPVPVDDTRPPWMRDSEFRVPGP